MGGQNRVGMMDEIRMNGALAHRGPLLVNELNFLLTNMVEFLFRWRLATIEGGSLKRLKESV